MTKKLLKTAALLLGGAVLLSQQAQATLTLKLTQTGETDFVAVDNVSNDADGGIANHVFFTNPNFGSWAINSETGDTLFGSPSKPFLNILSLNTTAAAGAINPLHIYLSDTSFTGQPLSFLGDINASANNGVSIQYFLYADSGNALFGTGTTLFDSGVLTPGQTLTGVDLSSASFQNSGNPYSLTIELILTATGNGVGTSFDASAQGVPEGGFTVALLGVGISALGLMRWRLQKN